MYWKIKRKIFEIIQPAKKGNLASKLFDLFIVLLVFFSIASVFISTFEVSPKVVRYLINALWGMLIVFSVEYLLRIWTADLLYPELTPVRARLKYICSGMAIIDLISFLPFYLPLFLSNVVVTRSLLLLLLLRLFKLSRYTDAMSSIWSVFRNKIQEILVSILFVMMMLVIASLLIYYAEHDAQPDKFTNAFSGVWWAVATLTTVGYGDIYPVTGAGRFLGGIIALTGIGLVAVPTGIISAGFVELLERNRGGKRKASEEPKEKPNYCPHCGKKL